MAFYDSLMLKRLCLLFGFVIFVPSAVHAQQKPCTDAVAQQAEDQSETQHSWIQLYRYYRQFGSCFGSTVAPQG